LDEGETSFRKASGRKYCARATGDVLVIGRAMNMASSFQEDGSGTGDIGLMDEEGFFKIVDRKRT
jgi:acyl-CoA synthetase (AMP-forming)/AMP-acid ligase II